MTRRAARCGRYVDAALARIRARRAERTSFLERAPQLPPPLLYVIVASGNIYEDRTAAVAAAEAGAQIIAVIRSTGQSLLDFVPYGPTTEGFGGTYATQENFSHHARGARRSLRAARALRDAHQLRERPVHARDRAMAALERLDMLLNDSMYGILFRDINMKRTFVDQHFSRMLNAYSGHHHQHRRGQLSHHGRCGRASAGRARFAVHQRRVRASRRACRTSRSAWATPTRSIPTWKTASCYQVAQAQLARQIFPNAPLKYMPPTKHMTGDIFKGHLIDAMFNLTSVMTHQTIHLCGMLTEAIHTPFLGDRALALENARYVMNTARHFGDEIAFKPDGIDRAARARRARRLRGAARARRRDWA